MTDKLTETFNLPDVPEELQDKLINIEIPEDADLSDVSKLALTAYKEQMENLQHIEPKYRTRALEVVQNFLEIALNALAKEGDLKNKDEKLDLDTKKANLDDSPKEEQTGKFDRNTVLKAVK